MRVIKLNRNFLRQHIEVAVRFLESPEYVGERCRHEKILLFEPEFLAGKRKIVRVQDLGDIFAAVLVLNGLDIIAAVKVLKIEIAGRFCRPEPQRVDRIRAETGYRIIVGHGKDLIRINPFCGPVVRFHPSIKPDRDR